MVFNWDTDGSGKERNLMLPVQSPYYFKVSDPQGSDFLWYVHVKGERFGKWSSIKDLKQLFKMPEFKDAQATLTTLIRAGDLPGIIQKLGKPSGQYNVSMVYYRGDELAATNPIFVK